MIIYSAFLLSTCLFHITFCLDIANNTDDDLCTLPLVRRKRYKRWEKESDGSPEFLVKVVEDDTTPSVPQANAPQPYKEEKIIVGGVAVPSPTSPKENEPQDYTRFYPPTDKKDVIIEMYPVARTSIPTIDRPTRPKVKGVIKKKPLKHLPGNRERDESPPANPQFVPRTAPILAQYAPIAPVAFSQYPTRTLNPVTPPTRRAYPQRTTLEFATRTEWGKSPPTKTWPSSDAFRRFTNNGINPTRTPSWDIPKRTSPVTTEENREKIFEDSGQAYAIGKELSYNVVYDEEIKNSIDKFPLRNDTEKLESKGNTYAEEESDKDVEDAKPRVLDNVTMSTQNTSEVFVTISPILKRKERTTVCDLTNYRKLDFKSSRTLPEIVQQLHTWAEESPIVKMIDITGGNLTVMENPIYMMIIDDPSNGQILSAKKTVMIVAGIQGRDHYAVAAAMFVLDQLIQKTDSHIDLLTKFRFWIIPVFNPDGYSFSKTFPHRREWKKNLRQSWEECRNREFCKDCEPYGIRCTVQSCFGVNLDRNFEYQWIPAEELVSEHECGSLYAGHRQLSEVETSALTNYLHVTHRMPLSYFLAFKEGEVLGVLYPHSHTKKKRPSDKDYRRKALLAATAAIDVKGRSYVAGQASEFLPLYAGGIEDWMEGHLGIDNTYTIMIYRPSDIYDSIKNTMASVVHEAFAAMDALLLHDSTQDAVQSNVMLTQSASKCQRPSLALRTFLVMIILHKYFGSISSSGLVIIFL